MTELLKARVGTALKALRDGCDANPHGIAVSNVSGHTVKVKKNGAGAKRWFVDGNACSQLDVAAFLMAKFKKQAEPQ
jgi:hypothetical protein